VLIETLLSEDLGTTLLDLGCGYGPIGIVLADQRPALKVTMVDINQRSIDLARRNVAAHRLDSRVGALVSDGYAQLTDRYDTIVTNPPIRAGKEVIYRFYKEAKDHLQPQGKLYLVIRKAQGAASTYDYLKTIYRHVVRLQREAGYHVYQAHD
jgi:16S rRNA (guanine1207-N2)-methyltransferase